MKKQFIAKLLALALVLSMAPAAVLAASADGAAGDINQSPSGSYDPTVPDTAPVTTTVDAAEVKVENGSATIEAKVVAGTATVVVSEKALEAMAEQVTGDELVLKVEAKGATKVDVSIPAKALTAFAEKTGANLTYEMGDVATISIPNEALATVFGDVGTARISAQASGYNIGFTIQAGGKALKNTDGIKVEF